MEFYFGNLEGVTVLTRFVAPVSEVSLVADKPVFIGDSCMFSLAIPFVSCLLAVVGASTIEGPHLLGGP